MTKYLIKLEYGEGEGGEGVVVITLKNYFIKINSIKLLLCHQH